MGTLRRHTWKEILEDCPHETLEDGPCDCAERDAQAYDAEIERRIDLIREGEG